MDYNILQFGATGDEITNDTPSIQKGFHDLRPTFGAHCAEKGLHYLPAHNVLDTVLRTAGSALLPAWPLYLIPLLPSPTARIYRYRGNAL